MANRFPLIYGIVNGTCNYILTRMTAEGKDFNDVLAEAQKLGYAEADPSLDVDGGDSAHKATILASLAHGFWTGFDNTYVEGIRHVSQFDIQIARELGYTIKLLAVIKSADNSDSAPVEVRVHPTLIPHKHVLASVNGVFNGVVVRGDVVGDTMFYGRGAGADATASAVISDLADAALNLKFGSKQRVPSFVSHRLNARVRTIDEVESRYYLRLTVADRSGVIAKVSKVLADSDISISSVLQREAPELKPAPGTERPRAADLHVTHRERPGRAHCGRRDRSPRRGQGQDRGHPGGEFRVTMSAWRGVIEQYRKYLPVTDKTPVVTLNEGNTPLIRAHNLEKVIGGDLELWLKYEGLNPTASFKDRGMTVAVSLAVERRSRRSSAPAQATRLPPPLRTRRAPASNAW